MSDTGTTNGTAGEPGADARDERLAGMLAVEPLDEVTRRRLVRGALDAAQPRSSRPRLAAAVSIAAVLLAGVVAVGITLSDDGGDRPTAASTPERERAPSDRVATTATPGAGEKTADAPAPAATSAGVPDLGDVSDPTTLRKRVQSVTEGETQSGPPETFDDDRAVPCSKTLGEGLALRGLRVVGAGTDRGRRVVVLTGTDGDTTVAISVLPDSCRVVAETFV